MKKIYFFIIIALIVLLSSPISAISQNTHFNTIKETNQIAWVDSVMNTLSINEKIAQLIFIRTYSNKDESYYKDIDKIVKKNKIGGLCFFQGGPVRQAILTNRWQEKAKTPLLIAIDAEWGLGMRLDSTISYPRQMTLGAISNDSLIYFMGEDIATQLQTIGTHINFAPVVDINSNPANPVINTRSFGEDKYNVAKKGIMYMKGLQDNNIIATAKHFPGHGDTGSDSHYTLPVINHDRQRLDTLELYPFKQLIKAGLGGIMTAHLYIPAYEQQENKASTLSKNIVTTLLSDSLGFTGLKATDALDMKGVTKYYEPGDIELEAFLAGNDLLLLSLDVPKAIKKIKAAVKDGLIAEEEVDRRCRKILNEKYRAGLNDYQPADVNNVARSVNNINYQPLLTNLYRSSLTVIKNDSSLLPLTSPDNHNIAHIEIGKTNFDDFTPMLRNYFQVTKFSVDNNLQISTIDSLVKSTEQFDTFIITLHTSRYSYKQQYGINENILHLLDELKKNGQCVTIHFGNPYGVMFFNRYAPDAMVMAYEDNTYTQSLAAQGIVGAFEMTGTLPVSIGVNFPVGFGISTAKNDVFQYVIPEEINLISASFSPIDSLIEKAIRDKAFPGCQLFVAKDGNVIIDKAYGYQTYDSLIAVTTNQLYDVASITKVAATTLSVMKLAETKQIDIDQRLSEYLPDLKQSNKKDIIIREMMAHQSGLHPWIPYYKNTLLENGKPNPEFYSTTPDAKHMLFISDNLFLDTNYPLAIYDSIRVSKLRPDNSYKYSDLGFILLHRAIESITNMPMETFTQKNFYKPLGLHRIGFNPTCDFHLSEIAPTEDDAIFRGQLVHGTVHDPAAAMLGGVSGHAGLFSNAHDLGVILQMLLQKGNYNGVQILDSTIVSEFTKCQFPLNKNRRGIGFDKPLLEFYEDGPVCKSASPASFGHSGFTGTYFWADPNNNLVYVFLSNRVYPDASNSTILDENVRTKIHQLLYDSLEK